MEKEPKNIPEDDLPPPLLQYVSEELFNLTLVPHQPGDDQRAIEKPEPSLPPGAPTQYNFNPETYRDHQGYLNHIGAVGRRGRQIDSRPGCE